MNKTLGQLKAGLVLWIGLFLWLMYQPLGRPLWLLLILFLVFSTTAVQAGLSHILVAIWLKRNDRNPTRGKAHFMIYVAYAVYVFGLYILVILALFHKPLLGFAGVFIFGSIGYAFSLLSTCLVGMSLRIARTANVRLCFTQAFCDYRQRKHWPPLLTSELGSGNKTQLISEVGCFLHALFFVAIDAPACFGVLIGGSVISAQVETWFGSTGYIFGPITYGLLLFGTVLTLISLRVLLIRWIEAQFFVFEASCEYWN